MDLIDRLTDCLDLVDRLDFVDRCGLAERLLDRFERLRVRIDLLLVDRLDFVDAERPLLCRRIGRRNHGSTGAAAT